jgi:hypothetical protein
MYDAHDEKQRVCMKSNYLNMHLMFVGIGQFRCSVFRHTVHSTGTYTQFTVHEHHHSGVMCYVSGFTKSLCMK